MLERCSDLTRRHRFGGPVRQWPEPFLGDCLAGRPEHHDALVLATGAPSGESVLALASAATVAARPDGDEVEIGLLVEDAWQHAGMGCVLLDALLHRAWSRGVRRVVFQVDDDQMWVAQWAARHVTVLRSDAHDGIVEVEARLDGPGCPGRRYGR